jgi:hypothetical protein
MPPCDGRPHAVHNRTNLEHHRDNGWRPCTTQPCPATSKRHPTKLPDWARPNPAIPGPPPTSSGPSAFASPLPSTSSLPRLDPSRYLDPVAELYRSVQPAPWPPFPAPTLYPQPQAPSAPDRPPSALEVFHSAPASRSQTPVPVPASPAPPTLLSVPLLFELRWL